MPNVPSVSQTPSKNANVLSTKINSALLRMTKLKPKASLTPANQQEKNKVDLGEWKTVQSKNNREYADLKGDPPPTNRGVVVNAYTSFCELTRGHKSNRKSRHEFLTHLFNLLRHGDKRLAILPYEGTSKANSIVHATHIPVEESEFKVYFPEVYYKRGQLTVKCRITSSVQLGRVKQQIWHMLKAANYWVVPTQLKAILTGKVGWFYASHADLTQRSDFRQWLEPFVEKWTGAKIDFQVEPESERITVGSNSITERVLMLRCDVAYIETLREAVTAAYDEPNKSDIGPLSRYTFVISVPMGHCSETHLYSMVQAQKVFKQNVFYMVMFGVANIDTECELLSDVLKDNAEQPQEQENDQDVDMEEPAADKDQTGGTSHSSPHEQSQYMSLRALLYSIEDDHGNTRFHAIYPTADPAKLFILCKPHLRAQVLEVLHGIEDLVHTMYVPQAQEVYFPERNKRPPYVKNHPKMSKTYASYASRIVDLTSENPNCPPEVTNPQVGPHEAFVTPTKKRHRDGDYKPPPSTLPAGFLEVLKNSEEQAQAMSRTMGKFDELEVREAQTSENLKQVDSKLEGVMKDVSMIGEVVQQQGRTLTLVQQVQERQAVSLTRMSDSQDIIVKSLQELKEISAHTPDGERVAFK